MITASPWPVTKSERVREALWRASTGPGRAESLGTAASCRFPWGCLGLPGAACCLRASLASAASLLPLSNGGGGKHSEPLSLLQGAETHSRIFPTDSTEVIAESLQGGLPCPPPPCAAWHGSLMSFLVGPHSCPCTLRVRFLSPSQTQGPLESERESRIYKPRDASLGVLLHCKNTGLLITYLRMAEDIGSRLLGQVWPTSAGCYRDRL